MRPSRHFAACTVSTGYVGRSRGADGAGEVVVWLVFTLWPGVEAVVFAPFVFPTQRVPLLCSKEAIRDNTNFPNSNCRNALIVRKGVRTQALSRIKCTDPSDSETINSYHVRPRIEYTQHESETTSVECSGLGSALITAAQRILSVITPSSPPSFSPRRFFSPMWSPPHRQTDLLRLIRASSCRVEST